MAVNSIQVVGALTQVFQKPSVTSVPSQDAHKAAVEVTEAIKQSPDVAIVPVTSAFTSKINSLQGVFVGL